MVKKVEKLIKRKPSKRTVEETSGNSYPKPVYFKHNPARFVTGTGNGCVGNGGGCY